MKDFHDFIAAVNANLTEAKEYILWAVPKGETDQLHAQPIYTQGRSPQDVERVKALAAKEGWHSFRMQVLDLSQPFDAPKAFAKAVRPDAADRVLRSKRRVKVGEAVGDTDKGGYSHWTDHTKVIRTSSWRHKETGRSVSSGGATPWRTPAEKSEWEENAYFVFYDTVNGTTFGGRYDTEQKAQAALDKAKRDHQKEVAKYVTAPQVRKRIQELENEIVGIGNQPSMAGGAVRQKRAEDEIKRLKQQLRSLGMR